MQRLAMVARWKPVHIGHAAVLRGLVAAADHCAIGIGSSNRYDADNPFTPSETADMIRLVLPDATRCSIFEMPDFNDGPRWRAHLADLLGDLDCFVTANRYVASLMRECYEVVHPVHFVPLEERVPVDGTMVRRAMACADPWEAMVPEPVVHYLKSRGLVERFLAEFGAPTREACHA